MKKIALITGANKGIGLETARQLGKQGIRVLVGARDLGKGEAAASQLRREGIDAAAIEIDVSNLESIKKAAAQIAREADHLDVLINNAGVLLDDDKKKVSEQSLDTWRKTFDTNLFGLIATTQTFLPLLRKSSAGRIVNLSSILGSITLHATPGSPIYDFKVPAYNVSKSAVNAWTVQLAYELRDTPVRVNSIHPGYVKTDMNKGGGDIDIPTGAKTSVQLALAGADAPNGGYFHLGQVLPW